MVVTCNLCDRSFKFNCFLQQHLATHKPKAERQTFVCGVKGCGAVFLYSDSLRTHTKREHEGQRQAFACHEPGCGMVMSSMTHLKEHTLRRHGGDDGKQFECTYCSKRFFSKPELLVHLRSHTGERPFKCDVHGCRKSFTCKSNLKRHGLTHSTARPYECAQCRKTFKYSVTRSRHQRKVHRSGGSESEAAEKCGICSKLFTCKTSVRRHIRSIHTAERSYSCPLCAYTCTNAQRLHTHIHSHTGEKPFKCEYCERHYTTASHRTEHIKTKHVSGHHMSGRSVSTNSTGLQLQPDKNFNVVLRLKRLVPSDLQCVVCNKYFCSAVELRAHQTEEHQPTPTNQPSLSPFVMPVAAAHAVPSFCGICALFFTDRLSLRHHNAEAGHGTRCIHPGCGKEFNCASEMNMHFQRMHLPKAEQRKLHACTLCPSRFFTKGNLRLHGRVHTGAGERRFPCTLCDAALSTMEMLHSHLRRHTGEKPYMCTVCGKGFVIASALNLHIHRHSGKKPHACVTCRKPFATKADLQNHEMIHKEAKNFVCKVCGIGFRQKSNHRRHVKLHLPKAKVKCDFCGKRVRKDDLKRHIHALHTGERPHVCPLCPKTFPDASQRRQHLRTHTGERPYACTRTNCGRSFQTKCHLQRHELCVHKRKNSRIVNSPKSPIRS